MDVPAQLLPVEDQDGIAGVRVAAGSPSVPRP